MLVDSIGLIADKLLQKTNLHHLLKIKSFSLNFHSLRSKFDVQFLKGTEGNPLGFTSKRVSPALQMLWQSSNGGQPIRLSPVACRLSLCFPCRSSCLSLSLFVDVAVIVPVKVCASEAIKKKETWQLLLQFAYFSHLLLIVYKQFRWRRAERPTECDD